jgi:putative ABC transport system permease protein
MTLSPSARKAIKDVTHRKLRTVLVVLGISVGVGGLTAINIASHSLADAFAFSASERATPDVSVFVEAVDPSVRTQLEAIPNVKVVQVRSVYATRWAVSAPPGHVNMVITGYPDFSDVRLFPFQLTAGRLPGNGEIVMESSDRGLQSFKLGDSVTITTPLGPRSLTVVGLSRSLGVTSAAFSSVATAYMSATGLAAVTGIAKPNDIEIQVTDKEKVSPTATSIASALRQDGVTVLSVDVVSGYFDPGAINGLYTVMDVLAAVALGLSALLIINTITTLVGEQMALIGTMKAIGATRATLMRIYLATVAVYAVAGTLLGIVLGLLGGYAFTLFMAGFIVLDLGTFQVDPRLILVSIVIGLGVPLLAAAAPVWSGTRVTVREAITTYGVGATSRTTRYERMPFGSGMTWVPQTAWLGVRGLFRRRSRAILTLVALTFSASSFLAVQTSSNSVNQFIDNLFSQYGADLFVSSGQPQPLEQIRGQLLAVPNVATVERFENRDATAAWGRVLLTATEQEPKLYRRSVLQGRWFQPGEQSVLLMNEQLQQKTGLRVGDSLTLSTATRSQAWRVIGVVHDLNGGLGAAGVAITSFPDLDGFFDQPAGLASGFMVGTTDHSQAAVDATANRVDDMLAGLGLSPFVVTAQQQISRNRDQFRILDVLLYVVAAIVALVGILGLFNTLTTSVLERRREIGVLRSLGATGRRVALVFWIEAMALSTLAWLAAVVVGLPAAYGFVTLISRVLVPITFSFSLPALFAMLVFTFLIASLASVAPALTAARMRVAGILRYE